MIRLLGDANGGVGLSVGLVEPPELGERVREERPRERRLDDGRPEALVEQIALEREVPLEERDGVPELAPGDVRHAEKGRRDDLDRGLAESPSDAQGLPPNLTASS